ncbi:hypothetical protein QWA68_014234 [Fusarium oxysporum]|nr:hypothetical protein QWA68_014234 [Fusarium oxysporum]
MREHYLLNPRSSLVYPKSLTLCSMITQLPCTAAKWGVASRKRSGANARILTLSRASISVRLKLAVSLMHRTAR